MEEKHGINGPEPLRRWPRGFTRLALKINEVCGWFSGISAGPGIRVTKSPGATIISLAGFKEGDATGGTEGAAISVVGSDGKLNLVPKHSTWATPTTYPSSLGLASGGNTVTISAPTLSTTLSVKAVAVCDSGTPKQMYVLGSATF